MNTNLVISIDMSDNNLYDRKECLICLETIKYNDDVGVYEMECCKNPVHIKCLYDWYTINKNRKKCFICNQYNSLCADISNPLPTDSSYIQIVDTNNQQDNPVFIITNSRQNINRKFIIFFFTCLFILLIIILSLLFSQNVF